MLKKVCTTFWKAVAFVGSFFAMASTPKPEPKKTPVELSFPPELFQAVGSLIVNASMADAFVGAAIIRLYSAERRIYHAYALIGGMGIQVKLANLRIAAGVMKPPLAKTINKISDKIQDAFVIRDDVAHGALVPSGTEGAVDVTWAKASAKTGRIVPAYTRSLDQMRDAASDLAFWSRVLHSLMDAAQLPPIIQDVEQVPQPASAK